MAAAFIEKYEALAAKQCLNFCKTDLPRGMAHLFQQFFAPGHTICLISISRKRIMRRQSTRTCAASVSLQTFGVASRKTMQSRSHTLGVFMLPFYVI
jgi:hypothetical protein